MNTVAEDVKDLLVTEQYVYFLGDTPQNPHGLTFASSIAFEPDGPDNLVTLFDTGGFELFATFNYEQEAAESIQIRCRSLTYKAGYDKLYEIETYLISKAKYTPTDQSYRYEGFFRLSPILPLGKDESNRWLASVNFKAVRFI